MKQDLSLPPTKKRKFKTTNFKKNFCRIQFKFNAEQLNLLEEAIQLLEQGVFNRLLEKLRKNLKKRKLIKVADKSPAGWVKVKEYEMDCVTSNSEDKKNLRITGKRLLLLQCEHHTKLRQNQEILINLEEGLPT